MRSTQSPETSNFRGRIDMGCDCHSHRDDEEERVLHLIEGNDLRGVGEQALSIRAVQGEAARAFNKADRAAALNLSADVVQLHKDVGERASRQARRQIGYLIERIDERMNRDGWRALSEQARRSSTSDRGPGWALFSRVS
jgi:hypothetical protein